MIRPAERTDLDRIVAAIARLSRNGAQVDPRYVLPDDLEPRLRALYAETWFGRFHPFPPCWIAEASGELAGLISLSIEPAHPILANLATMCIENLWVEPPFRRQGLGRALLATARDRATAAGYPRHVVATLVNDERAVAFWRAVGFEPLTVVLAANERPVG